jgi:hypothetical protein
VAARLDPGETGVARRRSPPSPAMQAEEGQKRIEEHLLKMEFASLDQKEAVGRDCAE